MTHEHEGKNKGIKSFFKSLIEKIDKKMEEKAKSNKCCGGSKEQDNPDSCCK